MCDGCDASQYFCLSTKKIYRASDANGGRSSSLWNMEYIILKMCCVEVVTSKKIKFEETRFGRPQTRARHNVYITKLCYIAKNSEVRPFEKNCIIRKLMKTVI